MASIRKIVHPSGNVTYKARVRIKGFPEQNASFPARKEAKAWSQKMEAGIREGRYFPKQEGKERTFENFINRYIEKELPKKPKSLIKQSRQLDWWKKHLGKYYLCHITPSMIAELRDKLLTEKTPKGNLRTPSTANRYLAALSEAYNIAVKEWCWLQENPVLKISRLKENKAKERFLEKEEVACLLSICQKSKSPHLYPVVLFALATGARRGEILGLKWEDVDFVRSIAIFRDTKNGETRSVSLGKSILECLKEQRTRRLVFSQFVFPNADGAAPADIRTAWDNAIEESGLKGVCFHTLRHTAASHLTMGGSSSLEIAAILGHKTLSMVKRYSHLTVASTTRALNKMNEEILGEYVSA